MVKALESQQNEDCKMLKSLSFVDDLPVKQSELVHLLSESIFQLAECKSVTLTVSVNDLVLRIFHKMNLINFHINNNNDVKYWVIILH